MGLFWALLFVCNFELTDCAVIKNPAPFRDEASCRTALQQLGREAVMRIPAGEKYVILGSCGPRLGVENEPS